MHPRTSGQIVDGERAIGQEVRDSQLGRDVDTLRIPVAANQLIEMRLS